MACCNYKSSNKSSGNYKSSNKSSGTFPVFGSVIEIMKQIKDHVEAASTGYSTE